MYILIRTCITVNNPHTAMYGNFVGTFALLNETGKAYVCCNACGWIEREEVMTCALKYPDNILSLSDLSGCNDLMHFELKLHGNLASGEI